MQQKKLEQEGGTEGLLNRNNEKRGENNGIENQRPGTKFNLEASTARGWGMRGPYVRDFLVPADLDDLGGVRPTGPRGRPQPPAG